MRAPCQRLGPCLFALLVACAKAPESATVKLPGTPPGIGFDDLRYSPSLHRVLVPAGRSGRLNLIDSDTLAVTTIAGFSATPEYRGGHDEGPTSVDEAHGALRRGRLPVGQELRPEHPLDAMALQHLARGREDRLVVRVRAPLDLLVQPLHLVEGLVAALRRRAPEVAEDRELDRPLAEREQDGDHEEGQQASEDDRERVHCAAS